MVKVGIRELTLLCAVAFVAACSRSQPTAEAGRSDRPGVLASFTGSYDPATRKLTVTLDPGTTPGGLTIMPPATDDNPNTSPVDTFQIANAPGTGADPNGCGPGVRAYWGNVEIRSFFRYQDMEDVYAEITGVSGDNVGCQNAPAVPGTRSVSGLWSYGTVNAMGAVTRTWYFRNQSDEPFTFSGVVKATLKAPVAHAGPEFDWTPGMVVGAQRFAEPPATTLAHFVWNGTTFQELTSNGITFTKVGNPGSTFSMVPGAPYASNLGAGNYFITSAADAAKIPTHAGFTVCARIKPGMHPYDETLSTPTKVLVARGRAEGTGSGYEGWALMQMHKAYCFHYRTELDNTNDPSGNVDIMSARILFSGSRPENYAYDYICGGRNGNAIRVGTLEGFGDAGTEASTFADNGANLPLVIGAYSDGSHPARDGGVYEVIFDSRPFTPAVMDDIIAQAEAAGAVAPATYVAPTTVTTVTAADGVTYTLPPNATVPVTFDGTGLMTEGKFVTYQNSMAENTSTTGLCIGAEIKADGSWLDVKGGVFRIAVSAASVRFGDINGPGNWRLISEAASGGSAISAGAQTSWDEGSTHTIKVCMPPGLSGNINLYSDGVLDGTKFAASDPPNVNGTNRLEIGRSATFVNGPEEILPLSGARIRRVFMCPSPVAANCN